MKKKLQACFSNENQAFETPRRLFKELDRKFHFDVDLCASPQNALCPLYYTRDDSAFDHLGEWPKNIFVNPPFDSLGLFVPELIAHAKRGGHVVLLCPARTDTKYFQKLIKLSIIQYNQKYVKQEGVVALIALQTGRVRFNDGGVPAPHPAPFPTALISIERFDRVNTSLAIRQASWCKFVASLSMGDK